VLLAVDLLGSAGWAVWSYRRANATVDVTAQVTLDPKLGVLPGQSVDFNVDVTTSRRTLVVTFQAVDTLKDIGTCTSATRLSVVSVTDAGQSVPVPVTLGAPAHFHLAPNTRHVHLTVKVLNTHGDANCAVDLSVSSTVLSNA
jgi:hypothetical protein